MIESPPAAPHRVDGGGRIDVVVDRDGIGVEGGGHLDAWLASIAKEAVDGAVRGGGAERRVAREAGRGAHWIVDTEVVSADPFRARVTAIDVTSAVIGERNAVVAKLVHTLQNVSFAVQSVLEAIELDRPTGEQLAEYLAHLRDPAERLSTTMTRVAALVTPPRPTFERIRIDALVARVLEGMPAALRPADVGVAPNAMVVLGDAGLLTEALLAVLESGRERPPLDLGVDPVDVAGAPHARIAVVRAAAAAEERAVAHAWDFAQAPGFDVPLRLARARAIVVAHGGDVLAEAAAPGRVRLGLRLPLVSDR